MNITKQSEYILIEFIQWFNTPKWGICLRDLIDSSIESKLSKFHFQNAWNNPQFPHENLAKYHSTKNITNEDIDIIFSYYDYLYDYLLQK